MSSSSEMHERHFVWSSGLRPLTGWQPWRWPAQGLLGIPPWALLIKTGGRGLGNYAPLLLTQLQLAHCIAGGCRKAPPTPPVSHPHPDNLCSHTATVSIHFSPPSSLSPLSHHPKKNRQTITQRPNSTGDFDMNLEGTRERSCSLPHHVL